MHKQMLHALLWLGLLGGCATAPSLPPIRGGESVAIRVEMSPQASGEIKIRNLALGDNTKTGANSGAVVGALYGLSCGPLAPLCVPLAAGIGIMYGSAAGAVVGVTGALTEENAKPLRARLGRWSESHDMRDELRNHVAGRARKHWTVTSAPADSQLALEVQEMYLTSTRDAQVGFVLRVLVTVRPAGAQGASEPAQRLYAYVGPLTPVAVWLDEGSDFVDTSLNSAMQQIATQLVAELSVR